MKDIAMPRTAAANQRIREEQRAKILEAARKVFAHKGSTATMADVATAASVSQGLTYHYFPSKQELLHELVKQTLQTATTQAHPWLEAPGTPGERLVLLVSQMVEHRRDHPEFFQLFDQVLSDEAMPDDLRQLLQRYAQFLQDRLRQLIVEGQATGEVASGDPDQLILALLVSLDGLGRGFTRYGPEQFIRHFPDSRIFLRMVMPWRDER